MKVCVITDNAYIFDSFRDIIKKREITNVFDFYYSSFNKEFSVKYKDCGEFRPIRLRDAGPGFYDKYDLFISLHCKQIFPKELVENHRCINVHPGLNPYNRGWYPHVFSMLNKLPAGVTIHEMDAELDHGKIICQEQIKIHNYETSLDVYRRIQELEVRLVEKNLDVLLSGKYTAKEPFGEGNINYQSDFAELCVLDLDRKGTFREFFDILRATTFDKYDNAYFYDDEGNKVYVSVKLKVENNAN